ncbi:MAG: exodeoxyribonuclease VII small subunit [Filifactoraceae bacterium]
MAKKISTTYEDRTKRLEDIIDELQKDNLDLSKSLELYEEGIGIYRECKKYLEDTKEKIKVLEEKI